MDTQPVQDLGRDETAEDWTRGMLSHYVDILMHAAVKKRYESYRVYWDGTLTDGERFGDADEETA